MSTGVAAARPDGRATRWAGHRDRRRTEFVDAALVVIERDGPQARVDVITAELGVGRPALYRQFADRADLDRAVADRAADLLVAALSPRLQVDRDVDSAISGAIDAYVDWLLAHPHLYEFVRSMWDVGENDDSPINRVKNTVVGRTAAIIRDYLIATGSAEASIADTLATGLVGLADAAIDRWRRDPLSMARDDVTRMVAAMVRGAAEAVMGSVDRRPELRTGLEARTTSARRPGQESPNQESPNRESLSRESPNRETSPGRRDCRGPTARR